MPATWRGITSPGSSTAACSGPPTAARGGSGRSSGPTAASPSPAFRGAGLDVERARPEEIGAAVARKPADVARSITLALDDWARIARRRKGGSWERALAAARAAEPDPWRNRLRDALERADSAALDRMIAGDNLETLPPADLYLLVRSLYVRGGQNDRALDLLRRAWRIHPVDYLINAELAMALYWSPGRAREASRISGAEAAPRPDLAAPYIRLGMYLAREEGDLPGAEAEFRVAVRLRPTSFNPHYRLGLALKFKRDFVGGEAEQREALRLNPDFDNSRLDLGEDLEGQGRTDLALAEYREAYRPRPVRLPAVPGRPRCGDGPAPGRPGLVVQASGARPRPISGVHGPLAMVGRPRPVERPGPQSLATMPEADRLDWRALWADVAAVFDRAVSGEVVPVTMPDAVFAP